MTRGIACQAVRGSIYSIISSAITLVLGLIRSIGLDVALIHRQDVDQGFLRTYFSLRGHSAMMVCVLNHLTHLN
jgi:hypothetical protein